MKKILPILIIGILVLSGLGAAAITETDAKKMKEDNLMLSAPIYKEKDSYLTVNLNEATSLLMDSGKPSLPVVTKVYTFPFGTKIDDVVVTFSEKNKQVLSKKIIPAPEPVPLLSNEIVSKKLSDDVIDNEVYSSSDLYPREKYVVKTGAGLKDNNHVIYLTIRCYPVQYSPAENTLYIDNNIDIRVTYQPPKSPVVFLDEYDMVIITAEKFASQLQRLVDHKNSIGLDTTLKTVEDIYSEYSGRDDPEDIKLFIKDAIEDWNIKYVLLFGGRKGQSLDWYVPERRTHNDDGWESGYSSDLYFADIYKMEGNDTVFDDWDSNGNDIIAEWKGFNKDTMDFYPDVHIGRIPCRYSFEVDKVIDKIIAYETMTDFSWFEKAVYVSGDTFPTSDSYYEGEMENQVAVELLEDIGFSTEKLWTSLGTFNGIDDVVDAYKSGAGIVYFAGHGNPSSWSNHPPKDEHTWINGMNIQSVWRLTNGDQTPFVLVGGCHNSQYNVTMSHILVGIKEYGFAEYFSYRFYYMEWVPNDWSSWQLFKKGGGAIGVVGNSGLGYGYVSAGATEGLGGWLDPRHFDAFANQSKDIMGEMHSQAIIDYINIIGRVNSDNIDRKTIDCSVLLGDPSLKLGE
jgi:hypothetical protein